MRSIGKAGRQALIQRGGSSQRSQLLSKLATASFPWLFKGRLAGHPTFSKTVEVLQDKGIAQSHEGGRRVGRTERAVLTWAVTSSTSHKAADCFVLQVCSWLWSVSPSPI